MPISAALSGLCPSTTRYASGPPPRAGEECLVHTLIPRHSIPDSGVVKIAIVFVEADEEDLVEGVGIAA